jgi:hypothetical protein
MQTKRLFLLSVTLVLISEVLSQQTGNKQHTDPINIFKLNVTALPLKNYSVQYERTIDRKISFALAYRTMPPTTLPFRAAILKQVNAGDANTKETLAGLRLTNFAITPQVRFYFGKKGAGQGLYLGPFYRYASFRTNVLNFHYSNGDKQETISLSGKLTANTGGVALGAQWFHGKRWAVDWWILGPHYGGGRGDLKGLSTHILTPQEQSNLGQQLQDLDIPFTHKYAEVTSNSASLKLQGPWAGVLGGVLVGFRF